jgi:ribonuclease HI
VKYVLHIHYKASNNGAEYEALIHRLLIAVSLGIKRLIPYGDSKVVIDQVNKACDCRMDLPGPTTSVGTRTDYSVGPWDYPACATRHLKAWSTRTAQE